LSFYRQIIPYKITLINRIFEDRNYAKQRILQENTNGLTEASVNQYGLFCRLVGFIIGNEVCYHALWRF